MEDDSIQVNNIKNEITSEPIVIEEKLISQSESEKVSVSNNIAETHDNIIDQALDSLANQIGTISTENVTNLTASQSNSINSFNDISSDEFNEMSSDETNERLCKKIEYYFILIYIT